MEYGLLGLLHLAVVIWAVIKIMDSGVSSGAKLVWILVVLLFPLIGLIVWLLAGPR